MRVAAINDLSGFGKCSLMADISVMTSMGIEVCPVPTAVLTAQTGFPSYYMHDTSDMVSHCRQEWKNAGDSFEGILTGYMPQCRVADDVQDFANAFKSDNTVLLVDPVMGDGGRCYSNYSAEMLEKIKKLVSMADIITPNLTELCLLAGEDPERVLEAAAGNDGIERIIEIAKRVRSHDLQSIVVTGIAVNEEEIGNLVVHPNGADVITSPQNGRSYSGTGDLFAAALLSNVLIGKDIVEAVKATADFIYRAVMGTDAKDRNYGVDYEKVLYEGIGGQR